METLDNAKIGKIYKIVGFDGQVDKVLRRFLELGFSVGQDAKKGVFSANSWLSFERSSKSA